MKEVLKNIILLVVNVAIYFILQIVASFVQFALFGSGNTSERYSSWVSLSFVVLQALILIWLFYTKRLINNVSLLLNLLLLIALYCYFVLYIPSTI